MTLGAIGVKSGELSARLAQDHFSCRPVPGLQIATEEGVRASAGDICERDRARPEGPQVKAGSKKPLCRRHRLGALALKIGVVLKERDTLAERRSPGAGDALAVKIGTAAALRPKELARVRRVDHAEDRHLTDAKRKRDAAKTEPAHKICGAVDRIKHPMLARAVTREPLLLGEEANRRILLAESAAQMLGDAKVSLCDVVAISLEARVGAETVIEKDRVRLKR